MKTSEHSSTEERTPVDRAFSELDIVYQYLKSLDLDGKSPELSKAQGKIDYHTARVVLLIAVTYFEHELMETLENIFEESKNPVAKKLISSFLQRQYFKLFDFKKDNTNINQFLGKFGQEFKAWYKSQIKENKKLKEAQENFIFLNVKRNEVVHEDYNMMLENNGEEIYKKFISAKYLIQWLPKAFEEFEEEMQTKENQSAD